MQNPEAVALTAEEQNEREVKEAKDDLFGTVVAGMDVFDPPPAATLFGRQPWPVG